LKLKSLKEFIMSSVVRTILGAALLATGASAAMAQYATPPAANQQVQVQASTAPATVASNNAAVAPVTEQAQKPRSKVTDYSDPYGGHDPNSLAGARAFWQGQNPY
jgi:hypothetical protein